MQMSSKKRYRYTTVSMCRCLVVLFQKFRVHTCTWLNKTCMLSQCALFRSFNHERATEATTQLSSRSRGTWDITGYTATRVVAATVTSSKRWWRFYLRWILTRRASHTCLQTVHRHYHQINWSLNLVFNWWSWVKERILWLRWSFQWWSVICDFQNWLDNAL
jgi:hypothetical protein